MPYRKPLAPCLVLTVAATLAQPSLADADLSVTVVTASRVEQPLADVLPALTLITRADIERSQAQSLAELLVGEAGFEFGRNGGPGTVTSFFLRGANSTNLVVMIDGVRAQVDGWGSLTGIDIPLQSIERIELLRGNASALYGEAAIGGVIQIFTRGLEGPAGGYASVKAGSRDSWGGAAGYAGRQADLSYRFDVGHEQTDGLSAMDAGMNANANPDRDGAIMSNFLGKLEYALDGGWTIGALARAESLEADYDSGSASPSDSHELRRRVQSVNAYLKGQPAQDWQTRLDVSRNAVETRDYLNGAPYLTGSNASLLKGHATSLRWFNTLAVGDDIVNVGLEGSSESFSSNATSSGYVADRRLSGYFVGWTRSAGPWSLQGNLRHDTVRVSKVGTSNAGEWSQTSWLMGAGYQLADAWRLTGTLSTGFRAPSMGELSNNIDLLPETHRSAEVGLGYERQGASARLGVFHTRTRDAIYWQSVSPWTPVNIGQVSNRGIELSGAYRWGSHTVKVSVVSQDPWNVSDAKRLARRARIYGSIEYAQRWGSAEAGLRLLASGDRSDSHSVTWADVMLPGYSTVSLFASKPLSPEWLLRVKVDNLFDRRYQLVHGYNTPGRGLFATLTYQPKP